MCKTAILLENTRLCMSERLIHLVLAVVLAVDGSCSFQPAVWPVSSSTEGKTLCYWYSLCFIFIFCGQGFFVCLFVCHECWPVKPIPSLKFDVGLLSVLGYLMIRLTKTTIKHVSNIEISFKRAHSWLGKCQKPFQSWNVILH